MANPGTSLTKIVSLPISWPTDCANSIVSLEHFSCLTSSRSFIIGTGLKKCIPITLSGQFVMFAISEIGRLEVLVASIACFGTKSSIFKKISFLRCIISGTASITKSTFSKASEIS